MLNNEESRKKGSLYNIEIGLIVVSLLFIGTLVCLLYTIYAYMKQKNNDESDSVQEMNVEKVTTVNSAENDGITYDNPLFTRTNQNDDPFKDDFEENDKDDENFFLGKDIEEVSEEITN
ncbi:hypothetical protein TVAG_054770 [Trichomonas vaginalis G3]|uniref:Uncharacterized protein n=1 Tax=Trichomonas vaginalis (strain ATCC PRA-98 / G3) TaxID=412133 RepID=A2FHV6_TRIV3|nr:leucine-rich repeats (6 copies)-containing protein [Trichomonas vaginalis G3]EAX95498.1 hypothetical protein TVAG_054770 [Trichomonas vaginalis G3]KAI5498782.1 leucine-rich repeats (6 copies)-containing protein [Trichomonas vaginalis G3]|eukprot:XP_001308428.1 hypothetical protein [Trichomonas vaginalis G3]